MLDNNNYNNSNCAFGEQIVSYLYDETNVKEKAVFETHLNSCAACADEFAAFNMARSSVIEWRNEEFLTLETPSIEIPYKNQRDFYNAEADSKVSRNWLLALRKVFSVSPALTASASFAIVAICLGIIFFANKSSNTVDVASIDVRNAEQLNSSSKTSDKNFSNDVSNVDLGKAIGASSTDKESKPLIAVAENNNRKTVPNSAIAPKDLNIKISDVSRNSVKSQYRAVNSSKINSVVNETKKPMFAQTDKIPTLNNVEEDEDKSLRLAELLEDGDAR